MTQEPADIDLDTADPQYPGPVTRPGRYPVTLLATAGVLVLALAAGYLFLRRTPSPPPAPAAKGKSIPLPAQQAEPGEQIPLPPLDQMDALVRQLVGRLSANPTVAAWLTTDGLILNFVIVTSRIADGETPVSDLKAIGPVSRFRSKTSRDTPYIDPSSYQRYDRYAEAVSALDARGIARLFATVKPRVRDAYRRTGALHDEFDPVVERAIVELLKVPVVDGEVALEPKGIGYAFADPRLERMSAAQKQLLRIGPQNVRAVQSKLREIASYLGIPASRLPPPSTSAR